MSQQSRNLWPVFVLWAILVGPLVSGAADDDETAEDVQFQANDGSVMDEPNFEGWVYQGNDLAAGNGNAVTARARINSQLKSTLDELVRVCDLNEAQQRKLALAARGDMKRFFDQVEEIRKKFHAVKNDQNRLIQVRLEIRPFQKQFSMGLFGEESLFAKILRKTLTEEQQAKYQVILYERRRSGYRTAIAVSLANLGNAIALKREQHETLLKLLMEETQPPLLFGPHDSQVVMLGLSKLPTTKLKEVLDKGQWKLLQPKLLQASGTEDNLAQFGVIEQPKAISGGLVRSVRTVVDAAAAGDGGARTGGQRDEAAKNPTIAPADALKPE